MQNFELNVKIEKVINSCTLHKLDKIYTTGVQSGTTSEGGLNIRIVSNGDDRDMKLSCIHIAIITLFTLEGHKEYWCGRHADIVSTQHWSRIKSTVWPYHRTLMEEQSRFRTLTFIRGTYIWCSLFESFRILLTHHTDKIMISAKQSLRYFSPKPYL